jgi:2-phospho-L-lactate transferase/gluconeogenesis factor (CofD/UPF0052 family)
MAKVVFVMNLMSRLGETYQYKASDYLSDLGQYLDPDRIDYVVLNIETSPSPAVLKKYAKEGSSPVEDDLGDKWHKGNIIRARMRASHRPEKEKGDLLLRSMVRHDPELLAKVIYGI